MIQRVHIALFFIAVLAAAGAAAAENASADQEAEEAEPPPLFADDAENPTFEARARVHAGWELKHKSDLESEDELRNENTFLVRRARLKFLWHPVDWLYTKIQIDAAFGVGGSLLKDAYVLLAPLSQLQLKVGQFKKPFSGLELRSPARLRVINRGEGNDLIVETLTYGDRDLGAQVQGRFKPGFTLDYALGVFNGSGPNIDDPGVSKDVVARVRVTPHKTFSLGVNGSLKLFDDPVGIRPERALAGGGDARLRLFGFRLHAEALVAKDHLAPGTWTQTYVPTVWNIVGIISYRRRVPLAWRFALEPVLKVEMLDPDTRVVDDDVMVYTAGMNLYFGNYFRVMIDGEFRRSRRNGRERYPDRETMMVLLCLDI